MNISKRHLSNSGHCPLGVAESGLSDLSQLLQLRRRERGVNRRGVAENLAQEVLVAIFVEHQPGIASWSVMVKVSRGRLDNRFLSGPNLD